MPMKSSPETRRTPEVWKTVTLPFNTSRTLNSLYLTLPSSITSSNGSDLLTAIAGVHLHTTGVAGRGLSMKVGKGWKALIAMLSGLEEIFVGGG